MAAAAAPPATCSILVYHRFGPSAADSMTTTTAVLEQQLAALPAHGYRIVPVADLLAVLRQKVPPPASLVALTVDDGHVSVFTELAPLLRRMPVPVTLFIYPSAIGNASYAMTWDQLRVVAAQPAVEVGAHTYWHPDFRRERNRLGADAFAAFAAAQLTRPRALLHDKLGIEARYLAWPYGIQDEALQRQAQASGYTAAFALGERHASTADNVFALPRFLITDAVGVRGLLARLAGGPACVP
nr:polysaccharide deacetylase family protein [Massilia eburnea]